MTHGGAKKKVAPGLVALSSAAVLAVYTAGYTRTRSAAQKLDAQTAARRPSLTAPPRTAPPEPVASTPPAAMPVELPPAAKASARVRTAPSAVPAPAQAEQSTPAHPDDRISDAPVPVASTPAPANDLPASPQLQSFTAPPSPPALSLVAAVSAPEPSVSAPSAPAGTLPAAPPAPVWKDGTYYGWGTSRHGDIQAAVVIAGGRIASATIAQCLTRYSCSVIGRLPPQVAQRQSPEVDYVSGATQSTNAFYYAVVEALSKAK